MSIQTVSSINEIFDGFNIKAKCIDAKQYRHFAFYDIALDRGTRISRITRYANELALAMRAKTSLIVTPISEKGIVRISTTHSAADVLEFESLYNENKHLMPKGILSFLLGETDEGKPLWVDMAKNPHLLVAGSTGSGKSVLLHNLIANVTKRNDTKLVLVDTKLVEFNMYNGPAFKHFVYDIVDNYSRAVTVLKLICNMMESRYRYMQSVGMQSFEDNPRIFNKILIIIDEVSDLMLYDKTKDFEHLIVKLAQKARAAGIYIVLATQRPSVDVLTGLIKSNFPARVSCKVTTKTDSRVILDSHGAENLAGRGDAILKTPSIDSSRFQVAFVDPAQTVNTFIQN